MEIGDSRLIIQSLTTISRPSQINLQQLVKKIQSLTKPFKKIDYFHVLRGLNDKVDLAANVTFSLSKGTFILNGTSSLCQIR